MADIAINPVTRRVQFTGNTGLGPFAFTFNILADADIVVYKNTTLLTLTTDYTVSTNANGTGSITLTGSGNGTALVASDVLTIIGGRELSRTTDFVTAGDLLASSLNEQLDSQVIMVQQLDEKLTRSLKVNPGDEFTDLELPLKDDRKGTVLGFNATTGDPEPGPEIADVSSLAAITADISTLADIEDGTDATDAIQTVAGISSNVTTVAGIASNVSTVAGISSDVTSVAADATDIGTVATNIASVNTVAGNITEVIAVANDLNEAVSEVETVANDLNEAVSEIETVAASISNVDTVGTNIANVNTVAGIDSNVTTVAGISANVTTVAGISANVTTVAGISSDVTTVAADATDIGTVSTNIANVNTVAGISSNVTTVAGNTTNINTVAGVSANVTTVAGVSSDVTTVAGQISPTNNVGTVAGIASDVSTVSGISANVTTVAGNTTNINTVAGISANVTTVAGISSDVTAVAADATDIGTVATNLAGTDTIGTVATNISNVNTVAGISANVTTVAGISSDVTAVAADATDIGTVATNIANVNSVGGSISNVNTVATNISSVNDFADKYRIGASDPTTNNDEGDLFYNTTSNTLKVYTGSAWEQGVTAGSGFLPLSGGTMTGTITFDGSQTFDGRDVSADGAKLDGIETGATADQTASEILTLIKTVDGAGSGLDADTLDGVSSASFLRSDAADTKTAGDLSFADNVKAIFGAGSDLQIYHDGTNSFVTDAGTGNLRLQGSNYILIEDASGVDMMYGHAGAEVGLNYNGAVKLTTTSGGIDVTGTVTFDGGTTSADLNFGDNDKAVFGAGSDLQIYHDGSASYINDVGTGNLYVRGANVIIEDTAGTDFLNGNATTGEVTLSHSGASRLVTKSFGVNVVGELEADSLDIDGTADISGQVNFHSNVVWDDNNKLIIGNGSDLQIYHDGSDSWVKDSGTGNLYLDTNGAGINISYNNSAENMASFVANGAATLYYNSAAKIATTSTGVSVTGTVAATSFTGDGSSLTGIAAGATGGGSDEIFWENGQTVTSNYTITNGKNAMSAGPITINTGVTVTVGTGETWTVV